MKSFNTKPSSANLVSQTIRRNEVGWYILIHTTLYN